MSGADMKTVPAANAFFLIYNMTLPFFSGYCSRDRTNGNTQSTSVTVGIDIGF
jgi:hypothetical protein